MESRRKKTTPVDKTPKWARTRPSTQEEPAQTAADEKTSTSIHKPLIRKRTSPQLEEIDENSNPHPRKAPKSTKLPHFRYPQIGNPSLMCLLRQSSSTDVHQRWLRVYRDVRDFSQLVFWIRKDTSMDGPLVLWNEAEVEKRRYPELMGYEHELPPSISHIYDQESWNAAVVHATTISKGSRYLCLFAQSPVTMEDGKHVITEMGAKMGPTSKYRGVEEEKSDDEDQERRDEERLKRNIRDLNAIISSDLTKPKIDKIKGDLYEILARIDQLIAEKDLSKAKPAKHPATQDQNIVDSNQDENSDLGPPTPLILVDPNLIRGNTDTKRAVTKRVSTKAPTPTKRPPTAGSARTKTIGAPKKARGNTHEMNSKSLSDLRGNIEKNWNDDFTHTTEVFTSPMGRLGATKLEKISHEVNEKYQIPGIPSRRFFASQVCGIDFIVGRFMNKGNLTGVLLADDMGLGKTHTALGAVFHIKHLLKLGVDETIPWHSSKLRDMATQCPLLTDARDIIRRPTLIVVPTELIGWWYHVISDFLGKTDFVIRYICEWCPTAAEVNLLDKDPGRESILYLIDYDTYKLRCKTKLSGCEFGMAIFDQSHTVIDEGSFIYKALLDLNAPYRIQLSGTPIYSSINDWIAQSKWLFPRRMNSSEFVKHGPHRLAKIIKNVSIGNSDGKLSYNILKACVMPWTLRRCAQTTTTSGNPLINIPPMTVTEVRLEFSHSEKERLKRFIEKNKKSNRRNHPLAVRNWCLASLSSNLMDEPPTEGHRDTWERKCWSGGPVFRWMHENLIPILCNPLNKKTVVNKAVIFAPLPEQVLLVKWWMTTYYSDRFEVYYCHQDSIDGIAAHRAISMMKFHNDENPAVFILTPESAEGLAISAANYVVLLQKLWSTNEQRHALAHVHPITKNRPTKAFILHSEGEVDDRAEQLHELYGMLDYKLLYRVMGTDTTIRETLDN